MSNQINDGGPAFPCPTGSDGGSLFDGMSLRAYAAIHLSVPESGIDWLDAMITKANRDKFAGQALAGVTANKNTMDRIIESCGDAMAVDAAIAATAYAIADATLAERAKAKENK